MNNCMDYPPTWQEFMAGYKMVDTDEVYSNGIEFIPSFRVQQMMEHYHEPLKRDNTKLRDACSALVARLRIAEEQLEMEGALLDMRLVGDLKELGAEVDG